MTGVLLWYEDLLHPPAQHECATTRPPLLRWPKTYSHPTASYFVWESKQRRHTDIRFPNDIVISWCQKTGGIIQIHEFPNDTTTSRCLDTVTLFRVIKSSPQTTTAPPQDHPDFFIGKSQPPQDSTNFFIQKSQPLQDHPDFPSRLRIPVSIFERSGCRSRVHERFAP
ncbi:hypothetical protein P280DRAFT_505122 [Massarina eburnea CBS 473.64]|uniref:Uncharacterized protein n=1 Tax=Massarina eburnea CBS 473.64 TaxID=1395130 RepID=A0A6A6S9A2_9PLEO|nr:hypothetical protein P280DRAFT_505122 [Massarina eburnea CBS 473.64]